MFKSFSKDLEENSKKFEDQNVALIESLRTIKHKIDIIGNSAEKFDYMLEKLSNFVQASLESEKLETIKQQWIFYKYYSDMDLTSKSFKCLCGTAIKFVYVFINIINGNVIISGEDCANKFYKTESSHKTDLFYKHESRYEIIIDNKKICMFCAEYKLDCDSIENLCTTCKENGFNLFEKYHLCINCKKYHFNKKYCISFHQPRNNWEEHPESDLEKERKEKKKISQELEKRQNIEKNKKHAEELELWRKEKETLLRLKQEREEKERIEQELKNQKENNEKSEIISLLKNLENNDLPHEEKLQETKKIIGFIFSNPNFFNKTSLIFLVQEFNRKIIDEREHFEKKRILSIILTEFNKKNSIEEKKRNLNSLINFIYNSDFLKKDDLKNIVLKNIDKLFLKEEEEFFLKKKEILKLIDAELCNNLSYNEKIKNICNIADSFDNFTHIKKYILVDIILLEIEKIIRTESDNSLFYNEKIKNLYNIIDGLANFIHEKKNILIDIALSEIEKIKQLKLKDEILEKDFILKEKKIINHIDSELKRINSSYGKEEESMINLKIYIRNNIRVASISQKYIYLADNKLKTFHYRNCLFCNEQKILKSEKNDICFCTSCSKIINEKYEKQLKNISLSNPENGSIHTINSNNEFYGFDNSEICLYCYKYHIHFFKSICLDCFKK